MVTSGRERPVAGQSVRHLDRALLWVGLAVVGATVLIVAALPIIERWRAPLVATDPARYAACREMLRQWLPDTALAHMPENIPDHALRPAMLADFERRRSGSQTLILRCGLSRDEIAARRESWKSRRIPMQRQSREPGAPWGYQHPDWAKIEPGTLANRDLPDEFEIFLLWNDCAHAGTDETSGGVAVRERDGTVYFWVRHHWARFN